MAHICLQGCFYLSSMNDEMTNQNVDAVAERNRQVLSALDFLSSLHTVACVSRTNGEKCGAEILQKALEPVGITIGKQFNLSSPGLLYNIATFGLRNVNFSKKQRIALTSSALGILTELLRGETEMDFLWASEVCKYFRQNVSISMRGSFGMFVEKGMEKVTASTMSLLREMALGITKFVIGNTQERALDYLITVRNGVHTACELLPITLVSSVEQNNIAFGALSSIYTLIRALVGIVEWYENDSVKRKAKEIQEELIQTLSSSSALQRALGYYATLPLTLGLLPADREPTDFIILSQQSSKTIFALLKTAHISMSILLLWGQMVEQFAIREYTKSDKCVSLLEVMNSISMKTTQEVASHLQSNGPLHLLLSRPVFPDKPAKSKNQIHFLNLVIRYIGWWSEDKNGSSNIKLDLAVKAVKLLSMGMIHSNLSAKSTPVHISRSVILDSINAASIRAMGSQLNNILLKVLKVTLDGQEFREIGRGRIVLTLHLLNMLSKSIIFLPTFAKYIIVGQTRSDDSELMVVIVKTLQYSCMTTPSATLISSSCADVLYQLWGSCRYNSVLITKSESPVSLHPCDSVASSLYSKHVVVGVCSAVLLNQNLILSQLNSASLSHNEDTIEEKIKAYTKSAVLNILSKSLQILGKEAFFNIQKDNKESVTTVDMREFLKNVLDQKLIGEWYQTINYFEDFNLSVHSLSYCGGISNTSTYKFATATLKNIKLAIEVLNALPRSRKRQELINALVTTHSAEFAVRYQTNFLSSLSEFSQIVRLFGKEKAGAEGDPLIMIDQAMTPIRHSAENALVAFSLVPSSQQLFIVTQTLKVGYKLTCSLVSHLSELTIASSEQASHVVCILEDLLRSSERYLAMADQTLVTQSQYLKYLSSRMRLNMLMSALLLVNAIKLIGSGSTLSLTDQQRFNRNRLRLCRLISNTLDSLTFTKPDTNVFISSQFQYSFNCAISDNIYEKISNVEGVPLNLLRVAISLLTALIPSSTATTSPSLSSNAFESDLSITLRNYNLISIILRHLDNASSAASMTYQVILKGEASQGEKSIANSSIHDNSVDIITRIFHFAHCIADSRNVELSILMLEDRFVQSLMKCRILSHACQHWSLSTRGATAYLRGYLGSYAICPTVSKDLIHRKRKYRKSDPVHDIWRSALQILAALMRSCKSSNIGTVETNSRHCSLAIIDFICTFEDSILSCIENCSFRTSHEFNSSASTAPSSEIGFTVNLLNETCDILSLLSELCSEGYRYQFEASSPQFYRKVVEASLNITKTLSRFLGAVGTARELFFVLSTLNTLIGDDGVEDNELTPPAHETFIAHPLMCDGISNAKHEAIRNALYASSCCVYITDNEYMLSQSKMKSSVLCLTDETGSTMNLEQTCQNHLDNDFTLLIEHISAQCVFNALSVIEKTHPSVSCFINFNKNEAINLNLSSTPPSGAIVAIRTHSAANILYPHDVRYGRVVDYNVINETVDVHYFDSKKFINFENEENDIPLRRLAGIEDTSKRSNVVQCHPAPNSVSDTMGDNESMSASLGDLIQILRWCRQYDLGATNENNFIRLKKGIVIAIASSSAMLLGNEVALYLELGSFTFVSEESFKELNRQLLDLFDNKVFTNELKSFVDNDVWEVVLQQINELLSIGKIEREKKRKASDQNGTDLLSLGWGHTVQRGERRSPFKMTFFKR